MIRNKGLDDRPSEEAGFIDGLFRDRVEEQRSENTAQPIVNGNIKANLLSAQYGRRQFPLHQLAQYEF